MSPGMIVSVDSDSVKIIVLFVSLRIHFGPASALMYSAKQLHGRTAQAITTSDGLCIGMRNRKTRILFTLVVVTVLLCDVVRWVTCESSC